MTIVVHPIFDHPLGEDATLIPRSAAIGDAYFELLSANQKRLARWEPWAATPPARADTLDHLEANGTAWAAGRLIPVAIAVRAGDGWQLVGAAGLRVDVHNRSAELGYWIDADHEGRGLVTRAATALLDHGFGPMRLARVSLETLSDNDRSRAVADRLGFTHEGTHRAAVCFGDHRRDSVTYAMLADDWVSRR